MSKYKNKYFEIVKLIQPYNHRYEKTQFIKTFIFIPSSTIYSTDGVYFLPFKIDFCWTRRIIVKFIFFLTNIYKVLQHKKRNNEI